VTLAMIVPSRGRPESIAELWKAWQATTLGDPWMIVGLDDDDPRLRDYRAVGCGRDIPAIVGPRIRLGPTLNKLASVLALSFETLGFMGDDHRPRTIGWDKRFDECLSGGTGICYGNDLLQGEKLPTAVALTSDIVSTLGYMCPPGLTHLCLDTAWLEWGRGIERLTYLADVVIEHMHPAAGKAKLDAGYVEVNSREMIAADGAVWAEYRDGGALAADLERLRGIL